MSRDTIVFVQQPKREVAMTREHRDSQGIRVCPGLPIPPLAFFRSSKDQRDHTEYDCSDSTVRTNSICTIRSRHRCPGAGSTFKIVTAECDHDQRAREHCRQEAPREGSCEATVMFISTSKSCSRRTRIRDD